MPNGDEYKSNLERLQEAENSNTNSRPYGSTGSDHTRMPTTRTGKRPLRKPLTPRRGR